MPFLFVTQQFLTSCVTPKIWLRVKIIRQGFETSSENSQVAIQSNRDTRTQYVITSVRVFDL